MQKRWENIPVAKSNFAGKDPYFSAIYRNGYVYYQIYFWVADSRGQYYKDKGGKGFYKSSIYRFQVSAPTAQSLHEGRTSAVEFAVDNKGRMVLVPYGSGKEFQFLKQIQTAQQTKTIQYRLKTVPRPLQVQAGQMVII